MPVRSLMRWLRERVLQDVPAELAGCEFECHRRACKRGDWENCPVRLKEASLAESERGSD